MQGPRFNAADREHKPQVREHNPALPNSTLQTIFDPGYALVDVHLILTYIIIYKQVSQYVE